ncbi:MAG: ABC transporter substrate-binding protein [Holosporaceae bacterium]|jgi:trehalose/maltose transport system substrate-binding protein|nr:ABC transporter substrate-binding protein [Holosporaceae bacterium]
MKFLFSVLAIFCFFSSDCATLKIACRSKGMELEMLRNAIDVWIEKTGHQHKVEIIILPHSSNECFALYKQWLSAESFDVDILLMDVAWISIFIRYLADLGEYYKLGEIGVGDYFDAIRQNIYSGEKMVALPLFADCGIIYYRADLLKKYGKTVPSTWQGLYEIAEYIQTEERKIHERKGMFFGYVFQAKAFEMLTCNVAEVINSFGGSIVKNRVAVMDSEESLKAILFLARCLERISCRSVLNYTEEDARGMFQSGNAVFMRSWPYAWSLLNDPSTMVAGKVGVMAVPSGVSGGKSSGVLGGWSITLSKYSKHKSIAADLMKFLAGKEQQRQRSKYSYMPTFRSLYQDPYVQSNIPFSDILYHSLQNAVSRPSADFAQNYAKASAEIYNAVNSILADCAETGVQTSSIKRSLTRLNRKLNAFLKKTHGIKEPRDEDGVWLRLKKFLGLEKDETTVDEIKTTN